MYNTDTPTALLIAAGAPPLPKGWEYEVTTKVTPNYQTITGRIVTRAVVSVSIIDGGDHILSTGSALTLTSDSDSYEVFVMKNDEVLKNATHAAYKNLGTRPSYPQYDKISTKTTHVF